MTIDESEEKWGIGADHCWIEVGLQLCLKLNKVNDKSFRWNITNATDWDGYKSTLEGKLSEWNEVIMEAGEEIEWERAYGELVQVIVTTATEKIGRAQAGGPYRMNRHKTENTNDKESKGNMVGGECERVQQRVAEMAGVPAGSEPILGSGSLGQKKEEGKMDCTGLQRRERKQRDTVAGPEMQQLGH